MIRMIITNNLLHKKNIINNVPPRNKARLLVSHQIRHNTFQSININFGNTFISDNAANNWPKIWYSIRNINLGDKSKSSTIPSFKHSAISKEFYNSI